METKKKRLLPFLLSGALMLGIAIGLPPVNRTTASAELPPVVFDENNIALTFTNMSDAHVGFQSNDELLRQVLQKAKTLTHNKIDALQFCGDNTQDGKKEQAQRFAEVIRSEFDLTETALINTHGNHDTYWSGCMNVSQFVDAYGQDVYSFDQADTDPRSGNRHVVVKGYHFLSVNIAQYSGKNFINPVSAATEKWLKDMLDKLIAENPNQYIFVSSHSPAKDTSYGSGEDFKEGPWGASKELAAILRGYKQAILFSGHTHYVINDERNISQVDSYTQIQSGSTSDFYYDTAEYVETLPEDRRSNAQGMLCEVDNQGCMRIMRYDFKRNQKIKDYWYLDACRADGSHLNRYTPEVRAANNQAPSFAAGAKLKVDETATGANLTYGTATDDDMVYHYEIGVYKDGSAVTSVKSYSPWMMFPNLVNLPTERKITLTYKAAYPYEVRIVAVDSFGLRSDPLGVTMRDTTAEDKAAAKAIDSRIIAVANKTLEQSDGATIAAIRNDINEMTLKAKGYITQMEDFNKTEAKYYNTYNLTLDAADQTANFIPSAAKTFSTAASTSKGWIKESDYTGVSLNWNTATKNNCLGFDETYDLNGLHISIANMQLISEPKLFGLMISNQAGDKHYSSETLLITVNFETGDVSVGNSQIATSDCLQYGKLGATPFDLRFSIEASGDLVVKVKTVFAEDSFIVPANKRNNISHLTDTKACYVSFSPWENRTTGSFDVVAIHGGEKACKQYVTELNNGNNDNDNDNNNNSNNNKPKDKKCSSSVYGTCTALGMLLILGAGICLARKKETK